MLHWIAHYNDNTQLSSLHGTYYDIDRDKLVAFSVLKDDTQLLAIDLSNDTSNPDISPKRLIWRKRTRTSTNGLTQSIFLAGWQRKVKGVSVQSICYVTEDGHIVMSGQFQEDMPLMHAPKFREFELA